MMVMRRVVVGAGIVVFVFVQAYLVWTGNW